LKLYKVLIESFSLQTNAADVTYDTIGNDVCMGDHKPVYLAFTIDSDAKFSETDADESSEKAGTSPSTT